MTDMTALQYALYQAAPERIANDLKWLNKLTDVIGAAGANDEAIRLLFCMSADVRSIGLALDGGTLTDAAAANRLHELAGKYDMAAERLRAARAAVAELIEKVEETRKFLTHEQWGTYHYMEGSDVYGDLRKHADMLAAAIARCGGAS